MPNTSYSDPRETDAQSIIPPYVDWAAILAGTIVAVGISTLLTTFGAAIGLSLASPFSGKGMSAIGLSVATALWVLWIAVSSFVVGGYIAGRLRRRIHDSSEHESDVRDGVHGLVVWALGIVLLAGFATSSWTGAVKTTASVPSSPAAGTGHYGNNTLSSQYITDKLMRTAGSPEVAKEHNDNDITRILELSALKGVMTPDDRAYLISQVLARTGINEQQATLRVNDAILQTDTMADDAKNAAEKLRKIGVIIGFLTAASLAISAAAAWRAACAGGNHRDKSVDLSHLTAWR